MKKVLLFIQLCLLAAIIMSCAQIQRPVEGVLTHWGSSYPTSAQDLNLVDRVKSIRVRAYKVIQEGDNCTKGALKNIDYMWEGYEKSYEIEFSKDGSLNHISILSSNESVLDKKVSILSPEGQYIGFFTYDGGGKPVFKADYIYNGDTLVKVKTNSEMPEGYWHVELSYPSATEINYTQSFYESMTEVKELLVDNKVQEMWETQMAEGDTEKKHHTYTYNRYNDVVKDYIKLENTYIGAPEGHKDVSSCVMTYQYAYDKKGNWITKVVLRDGKGIDYLVREIVYY